MDNYFKKITYREIIDGCMASDDSYREEVIRFLRSFIEYLKANGLRPASIRMYVGRLLRDFLNNGYSLADLLGCLKDRIRDYSYGGEMYDEKDNNNTASALKHLWAFYWRDKLPKYINISISSGWQSFATNHNDHLVFAMENNKVFVPKKQRMDDYDYYCIQELIAENIKYLSPGNTSIQSSHGPVGYYSYIIGESMLDMKATLRETYCESLFFTKDDNEQNYVDYLNKRFEKIIQKYR